MILLGVIAIILPLIFTQPSTQQTFTEVVAFAICATSLTVLTGWLGQLSLGQMAIAGLGALFAARMVEVGVPVLGGHRGHHAGVRAAGRGPRPGFPARPGPLPGRGHLRVRIGGAAVLLQPAHLERSIDGRGQLAVRSGQAVLPVLPRAAYLLLRGARGARRRAPGDQPVPGQRGGPFHHGGARQRECRLRLHGAPGMGEDPGLLHRRCTGRFGWGPARRGLSPTSNFSGPGSFFLVDGSLGLVAMVVIGGMGSVTAAVIGAVWVIGIPALAPNNQVLGLLTSSIGLLAILLYFPRGLNQISYDVRDAVLAWADRRFGKDAPVRDSRLSAGRAAAGAQDPSSAAPPRWRCRSCR